MKHTHLKLIAVCALVGALIGKPVTASTVFGDISGDLSVEWGSAAGSPVFVIDSMTPGETEQRQITVYNNAPTQRTIALRVRKTAEKNSLSKAISISLLQQNKLLYGGPRNTLEKFFADSMSPHSVPLSPINPKSSALYTINVHFSETAGNQYQEGRLVFDLTIGSLIVLPDSCELIKFTNPPIMGTQSGDTLRGTAGNDIIMGYEGSDIIVGNGGDDCIIGGDGMDILNGGNGHDVLYGEAGNDILIGGPGNDTLRGGDGFDIISGGSENDSCEGELKNGCEL